MSNWEGYAVSVNCGEPLGCYQGTILQADGNTITLTKAFRNGFPYPKSQVTLNAADIKELKIIEARSEPSKQATSTVAVTKHKKSTCAIVCESLQANHTNNNNTGPTGGGNKSGNGVARSKPIDIAPGRNKSSTQPGSGGALLGSTPKRFGNVQRNNDCFGAAASPADDDFDFEGNLALFDKRASATQSRNKPKQSKKSAYRHDENVLGTSVPGQSIVVPGWMRDSRDRLTDSGQRVPALQPQIRAEAYEMLRRSPAWPAAVVLLARGAADVCLRVAGGGRRLDARNAHQRPRAAALVHPRAVVASAAVLAARLLAAHATGAHVALLGEVNDPSLSTELTNARDADVTLHTSLDTLPAADIVILALYDPITSTSASITHEALNWAKNARAHVVAIEPSPDAWNGNGTARASVVGLLPPDLPSELGQMYLVNLAAPPSVFSALRVTYRPPFGATSTMPLHAPDDD